MKRGNFERNSLYLSLSPVTSDLCSFRRIFLRLQSFSFPHRLSSCIQYLWMTADMSRTRINNEQRSYTTVNRRHDILPSCGSANYTYGRANEHRDLSLSVNRLACSFITFPARSIHPSIHVYVWCEARVHQTECNKLNSVEKRDVFMHRHPRAIFSDGLILNVYLSLSSLFLHAFLRFYFVINVVKRDTQTKNYITFLRKLSRAAI